MCVPVRTRPRDYCSSTEFMSTNVGTGLLFVIAAACLRFLGCVIMPALQIVWIYKVVQI